MQIALNMQDGSSLEIIILKHKDVCGACPIEVISAYNYNYMKQKDS